MIIAIAVIALALTIAITGFTLWVKGFTVYGRWDMSSVPHRCEVPDYYKGRACSMPNGSVWRCRECKKGWRVTGHGWEKLKDSLERELNM